MRRFAHSVIAIVIPCVILYGITSVTGPALWWLTLLVCFASGYPVLYFGRPDYYVERTVKKEYIINLHTGETGDLFIPSSYPNYEKLDLKSGTDGNSYMLGDGSIITTRFVKKKEHVKVKEKGLHVHLFCVLICMFSFLLWSSMIDMLPLGNDINSHVNAIINNIESIEANGIMNSLERTKSNLKDVVKGVKELRHPENYDVQGKIRFTYGTRFVVREWNEILTRFVKNIEQFMTDIKNIF